ncbi:hypothetical protein FACS1894139_12690 [Planctomycetales bacterium]|nr:hypothetical protein FACS1894107_13680 [Planctomycetales bacterium]GHS98802.1 hypothetical protein FACS1894108_07600 [Planctomycetales bacterium]GHT06561.1 hypothetical protein FACS1894139_12690 [Planctomycetales bacterium]GHV21033.1 hypothetical protein AGMMS49959_09480 [Planctomycetales bacterium]
MTTITLSLPDDLARRATERGLLQTATITKWLRQSLAKPRVAAKKTAVVKQPPWQTETFAEYCARLDRTFQSLPTDWKFNREEMYEEIFPERLPTLAKNPAKKERQ